MVKRGKEKLLAALARFGYPLLEPEAMDDPNEVLASLASSKDARLLEGFPVVLANCLINRDTELDLIKVEKMLPNKQAHRLFWQLINLSVDLFKLYGIALVHKKALEKMRARWEKATYPKHSL